jgi:hypothetical protein
MDQEKDGETNSRGGAAACEDTADTSANLSGKGKLDGLSGLN